MPATLRHLGYRSVVLTALVSLVGATLAIAAGSGEPDPTFDGDGIVTTDFPPGSWSQVGRALARQPDGRLVVVGTHYDPGSEGGVTQDIAIARYNTGGDLDTSFNGDGMGRDDLGGMDYACGVAITSGGKIVVSGNSCSGTGSPCDLVLARYMPDGNDYDPNFNSGAIKFVDVGDSNGTSGGLALQPDGKIVAAGYVINGGNRDFVVYRLTAKGALDKTFNGDGIKTFGFGPGRHDDATALVLQPDGKIVVAGYTCEATGDNCDMAVARLRANGALDPTFSGDGRQITDYGGEEHGWGVALAPSGQIVVVGSTARFEQYMAAVRYNSNGRLDRTFNTVGRQYVEFAGNSVATDVLVQANGKIVLAGSGNNGADMDMAIARLKPGGALDTSFGGTGKVLFDLDMYDEAWGLIRQKDGKYVIAGETFDGAQADFVVMRILP